MALITLEGLKKWLDAYGAAWEAGDSQAVIELFADDAEYYETPFDAPMVGKDAIHQYWSEGAGESQKDVHFSYEAIDIVESTGLAQWRATFIRVPSGIHVELDGFLLAEFDSAGNCSLFREWWHRRESKGGSSSK